MADGDRPYVVPMCFGYESGVLYLHSAGAGRKIDILKTNPNVCVEFEGETALVEGQTACGFGMRYESVLAFGTARFIDDPILKRRALDILMRHYAKGPFEYPDNALSETVILRVDIDTLTGKRSG
jgi:nitroimidazol reductase NimA-like FMN-containing flavoprotein (pyridoxamine 5'-phosphate oxidase superfamily)